MDRQVYINGQALNGVLLSRIKIVPYVTDLKKKLEHIFDHEIEVTLSGIDGTVNSGWYISVRPVIDTYPEVRKQPVKFEDFVFFEDLFFTA